MRPIIYLGALKPTYMKSMHVAPEESQDCATSDNHEKIEQGNNKYLTKQRSFRPWGMIQKINPPRKQASIYGKLFHVTH